MTIDNKTDYLNLPLPHETNQLQEDIYRLKASLNGLDAEALAALRRWASKAASDAGCTIVAGSFERGATITSSSQVLMHESGQKIYSWDGVIPSGGLAVASGSNPTPTGSGGWIDRSDISPLSIISTRGQEVIQYSPLSNSAEFNPSSIYFRLRREWGIKDFGISGKNTTTDDCQKAENMLSEVGVIKLRKGEILNLQSQLTLPQSSAIIGDSRDGCMVRKDFAQGDCIVASGYNDIRGFRFTHPYQTITGAPVQDAGACIKLGNAYTSISDLSVGNAWNGIDASGGLVGCYIDNIIGIPYHRGIIIDNGLDVVHISNVHFNPNLFGMSAANNAAVLNFIYNNAEAFEIRRQDWANLVGLFAFGYQRMFHFDTSIIGTGSANNIDIVACHGDGLQEQFIYAPHHEGLNVFGGHWTTFNPWGTDGTGYSFGNVFGGNGNVNVFGTKCTRARGGAYQSAGPSNFYGVTATDVLRGMPASYVGEIFSFIESSAGSSIRNFRGGISALNTSSRGALVAVDDVNLDNFWPTNVSSRFQLTSDQRIRNDNAVICSSSKRPASNITAGANVWDTTLNKPIWFSPSGWKDASGSSV